MADAFVFLSIKWCILMKYVLFVLILVSQLSLAKDGLSLVVHSNVYDIYADDKYTQEVIKDTLYDTRFYFFYHIDDLDMGGQEVYKIRAGDFDMNHAFIDCKEKYLGIYSRYTFDKDRELKAYSEPLELEDVKMYRIDNDTSAGYYIFNHFCNN